MPLDAGGVNRKCRGLQGFSLALCNEIPRLSFLCDHGSQLEEQKGVVVWGGMDWGRGLVCMSTGRISRSGL